jgi:flagellar motor switch protein FliN/FliY
MTDPTTDHTPDDLALAAAQAAAAALPAAEQLTASGVQPGSEQVAAMFASGVVADLTGGASGLIALLVAEDLVQAMAESPIEGLELSAAVQPALDAAAGVLGGAAQVGRLLEPDAVTSLFTGGFTVVPLTGSTIAAALLVSDATLSGQAAPASPAFEPAPASAGLADQVLPADPAAEAATFIAPSAAPSAVPSAVPDPRPLPRGIEMLHGVDMEVTVELGRARLTVRDLLALTPGNVLELDRAAGSPADLLVNGRLIARGEVVVVDEDFGLRITEILGESAAG